MISGDPKLGKSFATCAIIRAVTRGEALPLSSVPNTPGDVIVCNAEDDPEDTFNPRLEQLGADLERVHYWTGVIDNGQFRTVRFPLDAPSIDQLYEQLKPTLHIIDPFSAYIDLTVNTWQDAAVRGVIAPIAAAAAKHKVAVVCVRHLVKSDRASDMYRGQGSIAFTGAARSELFFEWPDHHTPRRIIRTIATNNAEDDEVTPIAFDLSREGGFQWVELSEIADVSVAWEMIQEVLNAGACPVSDLRSQLIAKGVTESALDTALTNNGVSKLHQGGRWLYSM